MFTSLGDLVGTAGDSSVDSFIATIAPVQAEAHEGGGGAVSNGEFSTRWLHLFGGRLAICLVRNPDLGKGYGVRFDRASDGGTRDYLGWYITARFGYRWLNIDFI